MGEQGRHYYGFGPYRIDAAARLLLRDGEPVALTPKAFEILLLLVRDSERVVEKNRMLETVWPDTFVGEATLAQYVFTLRRVLGKPPGGGRYIETVPKRGYRFAAKVEEVWEAEERRAARPRPAAGAAPNSLAVLLVGEGADPEVESLSDGLTEGIINCMSRVPQLRVVARSVVFRYKGQKIDPQEVGSQLGVRAVLIGRVAREGEGLLVSAELVDVAQGWRLWGEQYRRTAATFAGVQGEIVREVCDKLHLKLTARLEKHLAKYHAGNSEAYQLYLRGRYHWNKHTADGYRLAIKLFGEAVAADPAYAPAYSGLADSYLMLDFYGVSPPSEIMPKARAAATKALELDPHLAEAHASLACVKFLYERDWAGAEREFKRAVTFSPHSAHAHSWYSLYLLAMGRAEESLAAATLALELDPLDLNVNFRLGWHYLYTGQHDLAIEQFRKTLEFEPEFHIARAFLGRALEQAGRYDEAIAVLRQAGTLRSFPMAAGFLAHAYAMSGRKMHARRVVEELKGQAQPGQPPAPSFGMVYAVLGEKDAAFRWLDKSYARRA